MFTIERNIPAPTPAKLKINYPFAEMETGDSFLVPWEDGRSKLAIETHVRAAIKRYRQDRPGASFTCKHEPAGFRVWKI